MAHNRNRALTVLYELADRYNADCNPPVSVGTGDGSGEGVAQEEEVPVVLITQFYAPADAALSRDVTEALEINLRNPAISEVLLLTERYFDFSALPFAHKVRQRVIGARLTFADAFRSANSAYRNWHVIIANADICFDETLAIVTRADLEGRVLALSKWKRKRGGAGGRPSTGGTDRLLLVLRTESQDAWLFRSPIREGVILKSRFNLGAVRCDNRLAKVLKEENYEVVGPVFAVHAIENEERVKNVVYDFEHAVPGEGAPVFLSLIV